MTDPYAARLAITQSWTTDGSIEPPTVRRDDPWAVQAAIRRAMGRSDEEMAVWFAQRGQNPKGGRPQKHALPDTQGDAS